MVWQIFPRHDIWLASHDDERWAGVTRKQIQMEMDDGGWVIGLNEDPLRLSLSGARSRMYGSFIQWDDMTEPMMPR